MKIILIGTQGSGKSTQGNLLTKRLHLPYLSMGHIFRNMAQEKTPQGRHIKELLASGILVPDEITLKSIEVYLKRSEYKKGWILDGFPRTLAQAKKFSHRLDAVFYLTLSDKESLWRLSGRKDAGIDADRKDTTIKAIRKRIELFNKKTLPVIDFYRKKDLLVEVNGERSVEEINKDIYSRLRWYQKKSNGHQA